MRKLFLLFFIVAIAACNSNNEVFYEVSPTIKNGKPALQVRMEFNANKNGETILFFQDKAWGEENLYNTISNLQSDDVITIIKEKDNNRIVLKHRENIDKISFKYILQQDTDGNLTTKDTYRPVIQKNFFHVFSHNFFMLPKNYTLDPDTSFDVTIEWKGFENDYNLINSFVTNERLQVIKNTNERKFHSAVFTGGDYRPYILNIKNNKVVFGVRGNWKVFKDSTMIRVLEKTLKAQRDFWKDHSQKYFAVTITPTYMERGSSFQGSGLTNSFATSATNNEYLDPKGLVYLFNHELQHNWIGTQIKNKNEEEQYWFSEGFTDYYTIKNIAKNKIYNLDESYFIAEFNKMIMALYTSPVREAPNSEINYKNYWSSRDYEKLPYRRGAIFAFYLDNKIRKESNNSISLDDFMIAVKEDALQQQKLSHAYFLKKINEYLKEDITPFFNLHIEKGKLYDLNAIFEEFGYNYHSTTEVFDLGFTLTADRKQIQFIEESSNAYKAGLRKGDRITFWSYDSSNPSFEAEFGVLKNKREIQVKFFPSKEKEIPTLIDNLNNKNALSF